MCISQVFKKFNRDGMKTDGDFLKRVEGEDLLINSIFEYACKQRRWRQ
jgi:hypothetical protein